MPGRDLLTLAGLGAVLGTLVLWGPSCDDVEPVLRINTQVDAFDQVVRKKVDVLLIVDNSCSMIDEQNKLAANFENFIEQFLTASVDYQIGVVTTDMEDETQSGRLVGDTKIITSAMDLDTARDTFVDNVKVCATGSGFERGLAAAEAALSEPILSAENAGFLRDDAALSIVFVSDEEDGSARPVGEFLTFFKGLKGDAGYRDDTLVNLSAVVGEPPDGCLQPSPYVPNCIDGLDEEDGDGLIDCEDPDCASAWQCTVVPPETDCTDGVDNDGDGAADCEDGDCSYLGHCRELDCTDGIDNDNDGTLDCADVDCLVDQFATCGEISCTDGELVHQGGQFPNVLRDCDDPSCFTNPAFEELCLNVGGRAPIDYKERCDLNVVFDEVSGGVYNLDGPDVDDASTLDNELRGCDDPDCATYWLCQPQLRMEGHQSCGDCLDNDGDGLDDCDDVDCLTSPNCDNPYPIDAGNRYIDVAVRSGGVVTSICAEEFSGLVRELGLNISGLRTVFYLTAWPRIETIALYLDEQIESNRLTEGFDYDPIDNKISFAEGSVPPEGSTLIVYYERANVPPSEQTPEGVR
jgi:hypothetical protein